MSLFQSTAPSQRLLYQTELQSNAPTLWLTVELGFEYIFKDISIHSPIAEADSGYKLLDAREVDFNPQPHRRG